jgi:hypothetical protein
MFGKAVKIRHCPATVSAPESFSVVWKKHTQESGQVPLGFSAKEMSGKAVRKGASQDTGPMVPITCLRSEGNGGH